MNYTVLTCPPPRRTHKIKPFFTLEHTMRRLALLTLCLAATAVNAAGFSEKDTPFNTRYKESPEEAAALRVRRTKNRAPAAARHPIRRLVRPLRQRRLR